MQANRQTNISDEQATAAEEQIIEQLKKIDFYITEFSVELLALKMQRKELEIPGYQRNFTWEESRKSRFVESIMMGLPIPFLFFWESSVTGGLEIVDGSQRLRTIEEFLAGNLILSGLKKLYLLNGFSFFDFSASRQKKIKNRSIRGIVLNESADETSRFDLFERINTSSKMANTAEVRRGALPGKFLELVIELAEEPMFKQLAPTSEKQEREREGEELVTRFFAYGDGLEDYKDDVAGFIYRYSEKMNAYFHENPSEISLYRQRFLHTMQFVQQNFVFGFRRVPKGKITPRARFEAIALGSYFALQQRPSITNKPLQVQDWLHSEEFNDIVGSDGANVTSKLKGRINFVREKLLKDS
jgi:hypothetical protein